MTVGTPLITVAEILTFATESAALNYQGNFCRKNRLQKSDFRD